MASKPSVALRLGMEGKTEIKDGFAEIGASGDAAAKRAAAAFQRAGEDITAATQRQAQAAQKLANFAPNVNVGTERQGPSTSLYTDYQKGLADQARAAEALRNAIDPLRVRRPLTIASSRWRTTCSRPAISTNRSTHARSRWQVGPMTTRKCALPAWAAGLSDPACRR
jgi:hypothetical protein